MKSGEGEEEEYRLLNLTGLTQDPAPGPTESGDDVSQSVVVAPWLRYEPWRAAEAVKA